MAFTAFAQSNKGQLIEPKPDFHPHELKVGVNLVRMGQNAFADGLSTTEFQGALGSHSYFLVLDIGSENNMRGTDYRYVNEGYYFRTGIDHNFVKDKYNGNELSLGLRYARAYFDESLNYTNDLGFEQDQTISQSNLEANARWAEFVFKLRGKVVSNLYMGMTLRWQVLRKVNGEGELKTYDVPGYGNTRRKNSTQFDYYLAWRIQLKEEKK